MNEDSTSSRSGRLDPRRVRRTIASLASRQHGIVTRRQLIGAGVSQSGVRRRIAAGRLRPLHRGVYQVGPVAAPRAGEMAAALACGPTAAVSHRSAAALWKIASERPTGVPVEVQVLRHARRRPGIQVHRTAARHPDEVVQVDGIPVTTPGRTLLDLASSGHGRMAERAFARALLLDVTTRDRVAAIRARYAGRSGTALLQKLLGSGQPALTRSEAEHRFLRLVRSAGLPAPEVNVRLGPYEVDFYWADRRLAVEIDGFTFHSSRSAFERDRERDANLAARGIRVLRFTWRQLTDTRDVVLVRLAQTLGPP